MQATYEAGNRSERTGGKSRKRYLIAVVGLSWLAAGIYLGMTHGPALATAVANMPVGFLVAALAAQLLVVALRIEAWRECLLSAGAKLPRKTLYCAGSCAAPLGLINMQLAAGTKIGILRKLAPERSPEVMALCAAELPIWGAEVAIGAALLLFAAPALGLPWFAAPAGLLLIGAALYLLAQTGLRSHKKFAAGLRVLTDSKRAPRLWALLSVVTLAQVARIWLLLMAAGLGASPMDAAAVLVGQGLLSQLPIGGAGASGASVMIIGSGSASALAAAGLALTATELTAAFFFLSWSLTVVIPLLFSSDRATRLAGHVTDKSLETPITAVSIN